MSTARRNAACMNSALDQCAIVLPLADGVFELAAAPLARVDVGEEKESERFQIRLLRAIEARLRKGFHLVQPSRLIEQHAREQQIWPWARWILLDQRPHLLLGPASIAHAQKEVAEIKTRRHRLRMVVQFLLICGASFC